MNILVVGGGHFVAPLRQMGHAVLHAHYTANADLLLQHPTFCAPLLARLEAQGFVPELLVYTDDGNLPVLLNPQAFPCPSIWFSIDTYCNPWHMAWAHGFDATLVGQKDFVHCFTDEALRAEWFPLFCPQEGACPPFAARDIPVAFVGSVGNPNNPGRKPFLCDFRKRHPLVMLRGDYRPIFHRSRIVLNQTAFAEVNFRCFEAMACGAALLMEECDNGLRDLFTPDVDILPPYPRGDAATAAKIAADCLARPDYLADIAARGRELVLARHSVTVRAQRVAELAATLWAEGAHTARLGNQQSPACFVKTAFGIIASDLSKPSMTEWRDFYCRMAQ